MQKVRCLVEHAHWALSESCSDHVLDLSDSRQLGAFSGFLELDLACKQSPEDLGDELVVRVRLGAQNLLQDEQVVVGIYHQTKM